MLCVDDLRHAEYYQMQDVFDELYAKSQNGNTFTDLMKPVLSRENILLAYRNIKGNKGSKTPGTDKVAIDDVGKLSADEYIERLRFIVLASRHGYRSKPVRRKEIPKPRVDRTLVYRHTEKTLLHLFIRYITGRESHSRNFSMCTDRNNLS